MWYHRLLDRRRLSRRRLPRTTLEGLESRTLLALSAPTWIEVGPESLSLLEGGGVKLEGNLAVGAIQTVAASPTDPDIVYVGAVNGGVWKTTNATSERPTWLPLTDGAPSLSISALTISPQDPTGNTVYAGTGAVSNFGGKGTGGVGIYRTTDGGLSWSHLGPDVFQGQTVWSVMAHPSGLYAGGTGGVYSSQDGGDTWRRLSGAAGLPDAGASDLVADPVRTNTLYAALPRMATPDNQPFGFGVFATTDGGRTWESLNAGLPALERATRILLATHSSQGGASTSSVLYAAIAYEESPFQLETKGVPTRVFRSTDGGVTWAEMDVPGGGRGGTNPGGQQSTNLAIVADPSDPNVVYISGDLVQVYDFEQGGWVANGFRGDASRPSGSQWSDIVQRGANNTGPHSDVRDMAFDRNGDLLQTSDGGIYRLNDPGQSGRKWSSANGNIRVSEFTSIAYDSLSQIIFGGLQDNGTAMQSSAGSTAYHAVGVADGGEVAADVTSTPGRSIRYATAQNLGDFKRIVYDDMNVRVSETGIGLAIGAGGPHLATLHNPGFYQPYALNSQDARRILLASEAGVLFESMDQGDTLTLLGDKAYGEMLAVVAGGREDGRSVPEVAWIGTTGDSEGRTLFLRSPGSSTFEAVTGYTGSVPVAIAIDPNNWRNAWVLDGFGVVYQTSDGGSRFNRMSTGLPQDGRFESERSLVAVPNPATGLVDVLLVGTLQGVWATDTPFAGQFANWVEFGTLPRLIVSGMAYDARDNVLVIGTIGRGAWMVPGVSRYFGRPAPILDLNGPAEGRDYSATFLVGGDAVGVVSPELTLEDPDTPRLASAEVQLAGRKDPGERLVIDTSGTSITSDFNENSGILTLTGSDTIENYRAVLRTLGYRNPSATATLGERAIKIRVNDGTANGELARSRVTLEARTEEPSINPGRLMDGEYLVEFIEGQGPTTLMPDLTINAQGTTTLAGAVAEFLSEFEVEHERMSADVAGTNIRAAFDDGTLTLSGEDTVANYQKVLRTLTYHNTSFDPIEGILEILIQPTDGAGRGVGTIILVDVYGVNNAPVLELNRTFVLQSVRQGEPNEGTELVSTLFGGDGLPGFEDKDGDEFGIAITGADRANGLWQYRFEGLGRTRSEEAEAVWFDLDDARPEAAVLLPALAGVYLRFVPDPGFEGLESGLRFRLWDTSVNNPTTRSKVVGLRIDATEVGGNTSLSEAEANMTVFVDAAQVPPGPGPEPEPDPTTVTSVIALTPPSPRANGLLLVNLAGDVDTAAAASPESYSVVATRPRGPGRPIPIRSVRYDAAAKAATLQLGRPLALGQALRIAYGASQVELMTGRALRFQDVDRDSVRMMLWGRGWLSVQRAAGGAVDEIRLHSPRGSRPLVAGHVFRAPGTGDGVLKYGRLAGFDNALLRFPNGQLALSMAAMRRNYVLSAGGLDLIRR